MLASLRVGHQLRLSSYRHFTLGIVDDKGKGEGEGEGNRYPRL